MDVVVEQSLLAHHNLALVQLGKSSLTPQDVMTMSQLDPLIKSVVSILNRDNEGDWISISDSGAGGIQLPANSFLLVRSINSGRVRDEQFVILDSSARTATEALLSLSVDAQKKLGLCYEGGDSYRFSYEYSVADSLDQVKALFERQ